MSDPEESAGSKKQFIKLFRLISPFHARIVKGMIVGPLIGLLSIAPPLFTKILFDRVGDNYDVTLMHVLVLGILAFSIASIISESVLYYYSNYLNIKLENSTHLLFFNHIQHLPLSFFNVCKVGDITSRFQELKMALGSVHAILNVIFGQGIYLIVVPPFLFFINWKLALVAIVTVPLSAVAVYWISEHLRSSWKSVVESHAAIDEYQVEMLGNISTVKSMQLEPYLYRKTSNKLTDLLGGHMKAQGLTVIFNTFDKGVNALNLAIFTWLGWVFIINGDISIGGYVAFVAYIGYLKNPMKEVVDFFTKFQKWSVHLDRIFEVLDVHPEQNPASVLDRSNEHNFPVLTDAIYMKEVDFHFGEGGFSLKSINMKIDQGSAIVILGSSGSGKSTLVRLLSGLETASSGDISLDERSIRSMPLHEFRSYVTVVLQNVELFYGSLYENLTMGNEGISYNQVEKVVEICCLTDLVKAMPGEYNAIISEKGTTLSGGQKQRVALARALLRSSPVLILDEATSGLDVKVESIVIGKIISFCRDNNKTLIIVTHRFPVAKLADKVYVFDEGRIAATGSHRELMDNSQLYRSFQFYNDDVYCDEL